MIIRNGVTVTKAQQLFGVSKMGVSISEWMMWRSGVSLEKGANI